MKKTLILFAVALFSILAVSVCGKNKSSACSSGLATVSGGVIHLATSTFNDQTQLTGVVGDAKVVGQNTSQAKVFEFYALGWYHSAFDDWWMPASPDLQFGQLNIVPTVLSTNQEIEFVIDENGGEVDSWLLSFEYAMVGGKLNARADEAAKLIYDLHGNGPPELDDWEDGDLLRYNLFNGTKDKVWRTFPGWELATLVYEIRFYLNDPVPGPGGGEPHVGGMGGVPPYFIIKKTHEDVNDLSSFVEAYVHPTIVYEPNEDLEGISIHNFLGKGNNLVYVELLVYYDKTSNGAFDVGVDIEMERTPPISLSVKLDKDE